MGHFSLTPYPDVNSVLHDFANRIPSILGSQFVGLYLYGSLALGDFDPHTSDIDYIVVTQTDLSGELFAALQTMHAQFDRSGSPWAGKIEAAYIPRYALNDVSPTESLYPQIEKGTELFLAPIEIGWAFQRFILRENGIAVAGPPPSKLVDPVDPADMRRATGNIVREWLEKSGSDPFWTVWARRRSSLSFIVLTLSRLLFSLETGSVASKRAAAGWARNNLDRRWNGLIERSLASQQDRREAPDSDINEMLALLDYVMERSQQSDE